METNDYTKIAHLCYEIGTLRKLPRSHRQTLLTNDDDDNIGSHSHRVGCIAFMLAKLEGADPYKSAVMALFHDIPETRSGDQNWIHKTYVTVDEHQIIKDQFSDLPFPDIFDVVSEYGQRTSKESIVAKDADLLDQVLLLREYEWAGNQEATVWLNGKSGEDSNRQLALLKTESARKLGEQILTINPSDWWKGVWTNVNKK